MPQKLAKSCKVGWKFPIPPNESQSEKVVSLRNTMMVDLLGNIAPQFDFLLKIHGMDAFHKTLKKFPLLLATILHGTM
jgi:hypothetical protein